MLEDQFTDDLIDEQDPYAPKSRRTPRPADVPVPEPPAAPAAPKKFAIQPVDQAKFDNADHKSGKYQFLRTVQGFDPRAGITPEVLAALNKLGLANFSGSGQRLRLSGITDAGRQAGIDPADFEGDFIQNWGEGKNPNAQWAWDWRDPGAGTNPAAAAVNPTAGIMPRRNGSASAGSTIAAGNNPYAPDALPEGATDMGNNMVRLANGQVVDRNHPLFAQAMGPAPVQGGTGPATPGAGSAKTGIEDLLTQLVAEQQAGRAQNAAFNQNIRNTVTSEIADASKPVDPDDPIMAAQNHAYSAQQDRALAEGREAMAARGAHQGLPTGAMDASLQSSYENMGSDKAQYSADLMGRRLSEKKQQLQHALSVGAGILNADEARDIQQKIAAIDGRLKVMNYGQNERQGNRDLDIRQGGLDLANRAESNRQDNFYDSMGLSIGEREAAINAAIMAGLAGR